jgi:glutamyl/glutaminyl-tRNA synthetase
MRTRLAPTPSGYLHIGNLANFLLIEKLAKEAGGTVALRIDDCDGTRARPEFVQHVFETLRWFGINWSEGPRDSADFYANFSQAKRKEQYFLRLKDIGHLTYACACSRKELEAAPCRCREKNLPLLRGEHTLRLHVQDRVLAAEFGDVVLWRKDDFPAYHWVSVVDDLDMKIDLIVRGEDLRSSSELQRHIAGLLVPVGFKGVRFIHHPLLNDEQGRKLSKSQNATSVVDLVRAGASAEKVRKELIAVIETWGKL